MSRRRRGRDVHGVVLLDKPCGLSSNQALQKVRRLYNARKAGHTGSLDPLATGMLPICLGEASKTAGHMLDADKTYQATLHLGQATTTGDAEGDVIETAAVPDLDSQAIEQALEGFLGESAQVPPMYSALKVDGRPLYELARRGEEVERQPRRITVYRLEWLGWARPELRFEVHCSKGTYVRTLGEDIARRLGCCGHLTALRRTAVGVFDPKAMISLRDIETLAENHRLESCLLPVDAGLSHWPMVALDEAAGLRFGHGNAVMVDAAPVDQVRVVGVTGRLLGLGKITADQKLHPTRVFQLG